MRGLRAAEGGRPRTPIFKSPVPFALKAPQALQRTSAYLTHPVFNTHHSETKMMRYIRSLERKDVGLDTSMIPLGSCTMKLNAASEMIPVTWPEFSRMHPFAPVEQAAGLPRRSSPSSKQALCRITGFAAVSLQPNSGAQGEFAGLMAIRAYHRDRGEAAARRRPDPVERARHQPGERVDGGAEGRGRRRATATATSMLDDLRAKAEQHRRVAVGADGHLSVDATACSRRTSRRSARSSTSTAGRSTWTART